MCIVTRSQLFIHKHTKTVSSNDFNIEVFVCGLRTFSDAKLKNYINLLQVALWFGNASSNHVSDNEHKNT